MNERDFYKQLMSEYSFDHDKIKKAAMGKVIEPAKKKKDVKWIGSVCAAAAIALAVGVTAVMTQGNPVSVKPTTSVSVEDRFKLALEAYLKADQNCEEVFLYVTFMQSKTPTNMQSILARADDKGEIKVVQVYLADGKIISGSDNIKDLFSLDEKNITAVKIRCPGNFIKRLTDDRDVYLVETDAPFEDGGFSAIDTNVSVPSMPESSEGESSTPEDTDSTTSQQTPPPLIGDSTPTDEGSVGATDDVPPPETEDEVLPPSDEDEIIWDTPETEEDDNGDFPDETWEMPDEAPEEFWEMPEEEPEEIWEIPEETIEE